MRPEIGALPHLGRQPGWTVCIPLPDFREVVHRMQCPDNTCRCHEKAGYGFVYAVTHCPFHPDLLSLVFVRRPGWGEMFYVACEHQCNIRSVLLAVAKGMPRVWSWFIRLGDGYDPQLNDDITDWPYIFRHELRAR